MNNLVLRDASESDAPIIAELVYATEDDHEHIWGEGSKEEIINRISYLVRKKNSRYSYTKTKVAELDGTICGAIILLRSEEILKLDLKTTLSILVSIKTITGKLKFVKDIFSGSNVNEGGFDELYIANIATSENVRGRGVGKALMSLAEETARQEGYKRCSLLAKDESLINFYSKFDYKFDRREKYFSHYLYRMVKTV